MTMCTHGMETIQTKDTPSEWHTKRRKLKLKKKIEWKRKTELNRIREARLINHFIFMNVAKPRGKLLAIHYGLSEHSVEPFVYFPCSHRDSFVIPRLLNGKCVQNCRGKILTQFFVVGHRLHCFIFIFWRKKNLFLFRIRMAANWVELSLCTVDRNL